MENFEGMKIGVYTAGGDLSKIVTVVSIKLEGKDYKDGTLTAKLDDGKEITAFICDFARWLQNPPFFGCALGRENSNYTDEGRCKRDKSLL